MRKKKVHGNNVSFRHKQFALVNITVTYIYLSRLVEETSHDVVQEIAMTGSCRQIVRQ